MCIIEQITYVYADGYRVIQPYHRLCDAAVGGNPCEATRRYDLGARRLNTPLYPSTSRRSSRPSSSTHPGPEPPSPSQLGRQGSMKSSKETKRTYVKDRAVWRRRGSQILSDPGNTSLTEERAPKRSGRTVKHDVVVTQDNPPRSPATSTFERIPLKERHSDPDKPHQRPSSGRSSAAYSPTLSSSSAEPVTVLRSPLIVNDAHSSADSSRVPSLQPSTPDAPLSDKASRPAYRAQRVHRPAASWDQGYRQEAFAEHPRADSPRTPTDIETSSMSDLEAIDAGLARGKHREQMREARRVSTAETEMDSLRAQLANLEAQEHARREERRNAEDRERLEREHAQRIAGAQRLDRSALDALDKKRQTRTEGHRLRSGDIATTQTTRQRATRARDAPPAPFVEDAVDDEDSDVAGGSQQPAPDASERRRRRRRPRSELPDQQN